MKTFHHPMMNRRAQTMKIEAIYKNIGKAREKVKNNKKAMLFYNHLKEINKGDQLYGWMFEDDAILTDTLEDLDLYNENYLHDVLICYYDELTYIYEKAQEVE